MTVCNTAVDVKLDGLFKPRIFLAFRREVKLRSSSNLKQRFAALLKKFKVNEEEVLGGVDQVTLIGQLCDLSSILCVVLYS